MQALKVIGWGDLNEKYYWIVENSWGSDWGIDGLAYLYKLVILIWMKKTFLLVNMQ